jgi:hypothetical protein
MILLRRSAAVFAVLLVGLMLGGCLYDAPLSEFPSTNIDTRLLGIFEYNEPVKKTADGVEVISTRVHRVAVVRQDVNRYTILYRNVTDAPKKILRFTGWISRVDTKYYLTIRDDTDGAPTFGKFGFVRYQWTWPSSIIISAPSISPEEATSPFKLRQAVRAKLKQDALFPFEPILWERVERTWWDVKSDDPTINIPVDF